MKYSERLHTSTAPLRAEEASESALSLHVKESQYNIGGVQTYCWLIRTDPRLTDRTSSFSILMYSLPCGLIKIGFPDLPTAEEVFSLFSKYEVSPYHAEDIIEDREIPATIRFL